MTPHPQNQHERLMVCVRCQAEVLVCGFVADLKPESFVGTACGCRIALSDDRRQARVSGIGIPYRATP